MGPTDRRSKLRGFGATGRGGLNRGPAMAHRIGTGEPCPPMEEQRGWSPGQEDPSCLQWDSSRSRRTGPIGHQPLLSEDRGRYLAERTHEASDRAQYPSDGRMSPIGLADKKSLGRPTRRLSQHPTGDRDSRHRMDECRMRTASIGAHRETASTS